MFGDKAGFKATKGVEVEVGNKPILSWRWLFEKLPSPNSKKLEVVASSKPTNSPTPRNTQRYVDLYTFGHFVHPYTTLPSGKQQGVNDLFYTYRPAWH